jgi:hypothetical protein
MRKVVKKTSACLGLLVSTVVLLPMASPPTFLERKVGVPGAGEALSEIFGLASLWPVGLLALLGTGAYFWVRKD